jgi:hypothetical protein
MQPIEIVTIPEFFDRMFSLKCLMKKRKDCVGTYHVVKIDSVIDRISHACIALILNKFHIKRLDSLLSAYACMDQHPTGLRAIR